MDRTGRGKVEGRAVAKKSLLQHRRDGDEGADRAGGGLPSASLSSHCPCPTESEGTVRKGEGGSRQSRASLSLGSEGFRDRASPGPLTVQ